MPSPELVAAVYPWLKPLHITLALKRAPTPTATAVCFTLALAVVGFMVGIALTHHPLGLFAP